MKTVLSAIVQFRRALAIRAGDQLLNFFILGTFSPLINLSAPILLLRLSDERLEQLLPIVPKTKMAKITFIKVNFIFMDFI